MGKRKSGGGSSSLPLTAAERKERTLLNETERLRWTLPASKYLAWCRRRCRQPGGLEFASVRAVIWRDLLLMDEASSSPSAPSSGGAAATNTTPHNKSNSTRDASSANSFVKAPSVPYWPQDASVVPPRNCHVAVMDCDIKRSLWHLYTDDATRQLKRELVKTLLVRCLAHRPELQYYQGLHEVVGFLVYVLGHHVPQETLVVMVDQLLAQHLHFFCHADIKASESVLRGVHSVIAQHRQDLADMLERLELGPGTHYALSWLITWLTHHLAEVQPQALARIYDILLSGCDIDGFHFSEDENENDAEGHHSKPPSFTSSLLNRMLGGGSTASLSVSGGVSSSSTTSSSRRSANELLESSHTNTATNWGAQAFTAVQLFVRREVLRDPQASVWSRGEGSGQHADHSSSSLRDLKKVRDDNSNPIARRRHNATMIGLMCAALLLHHADAILTVAARELKNSDEDVSSAFGHVFVALQSLPNSLSESAETLEAVVAYAVRLTDPQSGRIALLRGQETFAKEHALAEVRTAVQSELATIGASSRLPLGISGRLARGAVTTLSIAVLAATYFTTLTPTSATV